MKWPTLFILVILSISSSFADEENRCFNAIENHISKAIQHNQAVAVRYSQLTDGRSKKLSNILIALEKFSRIAIKGLDKETRAYQEKGVALLCDDLADMEDVPSFQDSLPVELRPSTFFKYDYSNVSRKLKKLINQNQIDEAYQLLTFNLETLENFPNQHCITRHFLESMARSLKLASKHQQESLDLDMPDPLHIIKKFIMLQREALFMANLLDSWAFPLQKDGLLIFCQDLPPIDWK